MAPACNHAGTISRFELGDVAKGQVYFTQRLGPLQRGSPSQSHRVLLSSVFLRGLCNTWDDPSVFQSLEGSPDAWRQKMLEEIPAHLSRRYSWSFCKSASLPRGTVFLKRKKQVAKGRTIISYAQSLCSELLEMASIVLAVMAKTLYSDSPGMQSMTQLWKSPPQALGQTQ